MVPATPSLPPRHRESAAIERTLKLTTIDIDVRALCAHSYLSPLQSGHVRRTHSASSEFMTSATMTAAREVTPPHDGRSHCATHHRAVRNDDAVGGSYAGDDFARRSNRRTILRRALLVFGFLGLASQAGAQQFIASVSARTTLRASPVATASVVATIPRGASIKQGSCAGGWCAAMYGTKSGYVPERLLVKPAAPNSENGRSYINSDGVRVESPQRSTNGQPPAGASAQCRDGTYSFSLHRQGTCSHHGGVSRWLP